jgi:hypothetical protein
VSVSRVAGLALFLVACGSSPAVVSIDDASADDAGLDAHKHPPDFDAYVPPVTGPDKLSDTGLYTDIAQKKLAPDVLPYSVRYELWADGADKSRYLYLPPNTKIDTSSMDRWMFPVGAKAWKEFRVAGKLVETRMLWKKTDAAWFEVAYVWNADLSDAIAVPLGIKAVSGTTHDVPSQTDCNNCHMNVSDTMVGVSAMQLSNGGVGMLSQLAAQGRLTHPPSGEFEVPGTGVVKDAIAYLHANCAHCHNDTSKLQNQSAIRLDVETDELTPDDTGVYRTSFNVVMRHTLPPDITMTIVPGKPEQSGLWLRMQHRHDSWDMPPLGTNEVDPTGVATIKTWIAGLP